MAHIIMGGEGVSTDFDRHPQASQSTCESILNARGAYTRTHSSAVVACLFRGESWNTSTNYNRVPEDTKYSRDLVLAKSDAFQRLKASANSGYWQGRLLRVYPSTVTWNWAKRNYSTAISRTLFSTALLESSIKYLIIHEYWD